MAENKMAAPAEAAPQPVWKILVVDDEPAIHQVTKLALRNFAVEGRASLLISAMSSLDAKEQLARHPDIAVILLDVVMESDSAGLDLVRHIREEIKNPLVRIILRTGQPGQAPERSVMLEYDINDYKEKTELTAAKLFTAVMSSVRNFKQVYAMGSSQTGLEAIGQLNPRLFGAASAGEQLACLLQQFMQLQLFSAGAAWWGDASQAAGASQGDYTGQALLQAQLARLQAQPGELLCEQDQILLALPGKAALCLLGLSLRAPLSEQDAYITRLLAQSAAAALAHCAI